MRSRLQADLREAMKNRQTERTATLRMLMSQIRYAEIARKRELDEGEIVALIRKAVRERRDAAELYRKGGRPELEDKEKREEDILQAYLPALLTGEELERAVRAELERLAITGKGQMGQAMKALMEKFAGRVEGAEVKRIVASLLR